LAAENLNLHSGEPELLYHLGLEYPDLPKYSAYV
jgi:hypothetical protein